MAGVVITVVIVVTSLCRAKVGFLFFLYNIPMDGKFSTYQWHSSRLLFSARKI